jgi:putative serine protease PepD
MTVDTERGIDTGRSWRDLPPVPPEGDPLPAVPRPARDLPAPPAEPSQPEPRSPKRRRSLLAGFAVLAIVLASVASVAWWPSGTEAPPQAAETPSPSPTPTVSPSDPEPVAAVAEALLPSVVQLERDGGVGSGFIYSDDGLILTAAHVVDGASQMRVRLADGTAYEGTVVGRDTQHDVALVKIDASGLAVAPLALDTDPQVGQLAVAMGSPLGLSQTVTSGVVSALDRELTIDGRTIDGLIQTDAPINSGNSGGPLADHTGRVIGINIAIASRSGGSDGLGFAVPIATAVDIAKQLTSGDAPAAGQQGQGQEAPTFPFGDGDLFGDNGPFGRFPFDGVTPDLPGVAIPTDVPDGYALSGMTASSSNGVTSAVVTLRGPDGPITVTAKSSDGASKPAGARDVTIHGAPGWLVTSGGTTTIGWVEGGTAIEISGPASLGDDAYVAMAGSTRVAP